MSCLGNLYVVEVMCSSFVEILSHGFRVLLAAVSIPTHASNLSRSALLSSHGCLRCQNDPCRVTQQKTNKPVISGECAFKNLKKGIIASEPEHSQFPALAVWLSQHIIVGLTISNVHTYSLKEIWIYISSCVGSRDDDITQPDSSWLSAAPEPAGFQQGCGIMRESCLST